MGSILGIRAPESRLQAHPFLCCFISQSRPNHQPTNQPCALAIHDEQAAVGERRLHDASARQLQPEAGLGPALGTGRHAVAAGEVKVLGGRHDDEEAHVAVQLERGATGGRPGAAKQVEVLQALSPEITDTARGGGPRKFRNNGCVTQPCSRGYLRDTLQGSKAKERDLRKGTQESMFGYSQELLLVTA